MAWTTTQLHFHCLCFEHSSSSDNVPLNRALLPSSPFTKITSLSRCSCCVPKNTRPLSVFTSPDYSFKDSSFPSLRSNRSFKFPLARNCWPSRCNCCVKQGIVSPSVCRHVDYGLEDASLSSLDCALPSELPLAEKRVPFRSSRSVKQRIGPVTVCTDAERVDVEELSALLASNRQNCQQFPSLHKDGTIQPVDPEKLRRALLHSTVVVALYADCLKNGEDSVERLSEQSHGRGRDRRDRWMPPSLPKRKKTLVAFGRATSDHSLTASIYDLVVVPSYQRAGYGSQVLRRIVSELRSRGISDIAVTPPPDIRSFFEHCGFGPDTLKSVTMMYTCSPCSICKPLQIKEFGRKSLLIPPPLTI